MILPLKIEHASQVARLHHQCIKSLLSDMGERVCRIFYEQALRSDRNFGFVDFESGRVRGFTLGTLDNSRLFEGIRIRAVVMLALAQRPWLFRRILFHLKAHFAPAPEALYEAVDPLFRRQGIASGLYAALDGAFRGKNVPFYEIRIDADNEANLRARQKMGAIVKDTFFEDGLQRYRLVVHLRGTDS